MMAQSTAGAVSVPTTASLAEAAFSLMVPAASLAFSFTFSAASPTLSFREPAPSCADSLASPAASLALSPADYTERQQKNHFHELIYPKSNGCSKAAPGSNLGRMTWTAEATRQLDRSAVTGVQITLGGNRRASRCNPTRCTDIQ